MSQWKIFALAALFLLASRPSDAAMKFSKTALKATVDLGTVTFNYELDTAPGSDGGNANLQFFIQNMATKAYEEIVPRDASGAPLKLAIFPDGSVNKGSVTVTLPPGHYGGGKGVLFADGSNYSQFLAAFPIPNLNLTIQTSKQRVTAPIIEVNPSDIAAPGPDGKLHVPYRIKYPQHFSVPGNSFWAMAKGSGGYNQNAVSLTSSLYNTDPSDNYARIDGEFVMNMPATPGVYNLNLGLFDGNWKQYEWVFPGVDFEFGNWVVKADPAQYPSIATALEKGKAPFFIAGNFGNAIASIGSAANDAPNYYRLVRATVGTKILRENINSDNYRASLLYRHKVQQTVENMLSGGVVPCIAPQDMPSGKTFADQEKALVALDIQLAEDFKDKPVMLDVLNEPHLYKTWAAWKPMATRLARAVKTANPNAFVIVDAEGYAEDMNGASASPISSDLVKLYGWHSYHAAPKELKARAGRGIRVWLQEYHNASPEFHAALQHIPNLAGVAAWAWTTPGQDGLNLVQSVDGAHLNLTSDGQAISRYYKTWRSGGTVK